MSKAKKLDFLLAAEALFLNGAITVRTKTEIVLC